MVKYSLCLFPGTKTAVTSKTCQLTRLLFDSIYDIPTTMRALNLLTLSTIVIILSHLLNIVRAEYLYLLSTFSGKVGGGNSTYYKLTRDGNIRLILDSTTGDGDLYASDKTLNPSWDNYELQASSCGMDIVDIPSNMPRPVGIGIYGHPFYEESHFYLSVYIDSSVQQSYYNPSGSQSQHSNSHAASNFGRAKAVETEEESVLWSIFVGILKIVFDILV